MCIKQSVGNGGINKKVDVKVIQAALNLSQSSKFSFNGLLTVDGVMGKKTQSVIEQYQQAIVNMTSPDGRVDPQGATLGHLKKTVPKGLSMEALIAIMGHGNPTVVKPYHALLLNQLPQYRINSPLRISHFLAQVGHESMSLTYTEEIASGIAYEGRKDLGNTKKGDGIRFKGRGLIQLTGRQNYSDFGNSACLNVLAKGNERLISMHPSFALEASLWFWNKRHLNNYADTDDLKSITRRVNGGYNGLTDRQEYLDRAKFFLL
jgi:putative chitinase